MPGLHIDHVGEDTTDKSYQAPVLNLGDLAEISINDINEKERRWVKEEGCDYFFDPAANNGDLAPNDQVAGVGFWIRDKSEKQSLQDIHDSEEGTNNYPKNLNLDSGGDYFQMSIDEENDSYFDFWGGEAYVDFFGNGGGLSLGLYDSSPAFSWYAYGTFGDEDTFIDARSGQVEIQATSYNFYNGDLVSGSIKTEKGVIELLTYIKNVGTEETFLLKTPALDKIAGKAACTLEFPYKPGNYKIPLIPANDPDEILEKPKRLKNQVLLAANWVLNQGTGLYEYAWNTQIVTATSSAEFIPHPESSAVIAAAQIQPYTPVEAGKVTILAVEKPTEDITVDVIIEKVQDV